MYTVLNNRDILFDGQEPNVNQWYEFDKYINALFMLLRLELSFKFLIVGVANAIGRKLVTVRLIVWWEKKDPSLLFSEDAFVMTSGVSWCDYS